MARVNMIGVEAELIEEKAETVAVEIPESDAVSVRENVREISYNLSFTISNLWKMW